MFVPSAWIAVFLEAGGVLYCSQMEIYRTLSVNKKLVNRSNTCEVAPVTINRQRIRKARWKLAANLVRGEHATPVDWSGLPG